MNGIESIHRRAALALAVLLLAGPAGAQPQGPTGGPPPQGAAGQGGAGGPGGGPPLPPGMPPMPPQEPVVYVTAAEIVDGRWQPADPSAGAEVRGAGQARRLSIRSAKDRVNGLIVRGQGETALQGASIEILGRGKSDFDGIAAGVLLKDGAALELRDAHIVTRGVVASAVTATDQTRLRVLRSTLVAEGGPLPSGYTRRIGPGMMEPPTPLGISGTARTTLTMGAAHAYYADSTIIAEAWGALSTDAARGATLEAERCKIIVRRSGYGTYADNGASVSIKDSSIDVPTFGGVIAGQASLSLTNVALRSRGNGVMIHSVMGAPAEVAELRIQGGTLATTNAAILVKSANADITIDGAKIASKNGDLLLAVVNDDSFATKTNGQAVAGIKATLRNSTLVGNIVHLDTDRKMTVNFVGSRLKGAIRDAALSLDERSRWTATADSKVRLITPTRIEQIDAPAGVTITATAGPGVALQGGSHPLAGGGVLNVD